MALDKQPINNRPARPLSSASSVQNKAAGRTPLTPRLAAAGASSPQSGVYSPRAPLSPTPKGPSADSISTPVKTFLNANITPRSGARKARAESPRSTPGTTSECGPVPVRAMLASEAPVTPRPRVVNGQAPSTIKRPQSVLGASKASPRLRSPERKPGRIPEPLKAPLGFVPVDRARASPDLPRSPSEKAEQPAAKTCSFFYANGDRLELDVSSRRASLVSSPIGGAQSLSGSGSLEQRSPSCVGSQDNGGGRVLELTQGAPQIATIADDQKPPLPLRAVDSTTTASTATPVHDFQGHRDHAPYQAGPGLIISQAAAIATGHARSVSIGSLEQAASRRRSSLSAFSSVNAKHISFPVGAFQQIAHEYNGARFGSEPPPQPMPKPMDDSRQRRLTHLDELAANARTERKVLDLEISNSSLMAINRTLERKMRKQNAELRRFRRLSRSGRLSLAPSSSITEATSTGSRALSMNAMDDLSDYSEASERDSLSEEEDDGDGSSSLAGSVGNLVENDERQRLKDEKRLRLDLAKHQRLLVDSHKMNESLKRCLAWTEELIHEGKKALNFTMRVSDVRFGGRVLSACVTDEADVDAEDEDEDRTVEDAHVDIHDDGGGLEDVASVPTFATAVPTRLPASAPATKPHLSITTSIPRLTANMPSSNSHVPPSPSRDHHTPNEQSLYASRYHPHLPVAPNSTLLTKSAHSSSSPAALAQSSSFLPVNPSSLSSSSLSLSSPVHPISKSFL